MPMVQSQKELLYHHQALIHLINLLKMSLKVCFDDGDMFNAFFLTKPFLFYVDIFGACSFGNLALIHSVVVKDPSVVFHRDASGKKDFFFFFCLKKNVVFCFIPNT
jgi:hypothetical protein